MNKNGDENYLDKIENLSNHTEDKRSESNKILLCSKTNDYILEIKESHTEIYNQVNSDLLMGEFADTDNTIEDVLKFSSTNIIDLEYDRNCESLRP